MSIDKRRLVTSERKERFVEELNEHQEDGGDIGSSAEVVATFNAYARRSRNKKFLLVLAAASFTSAMVMLMHPDITDYGGPLDHTWLKPIVTFLGFIFYMPIAVLVGFPLLLITWALGFEVYAATPWFATLVPFLVALFWGGLTAHLLFRARSPQKMTRKS